MPAALSWSRNCISCSCDRTAVTTQEKAPSALTVQCSHSLSMRLVQQAIDGCILACGALLLLWRSWLLRLDARGDSLLSLRHCALTWFRLCTTLARLLGCSWRDMSRWDRGHTCLGLAARGAGSTGAVRAVVFDLCELAAAALARSSSGGDRTRVCGSDWQRRPYPQRCTVHQGSE